MTYIIGAKYDGYATIICDSRVQSDESGYSENTWLKSGLLFTGCSYAYSGSVYSAQEFIIEFKKQLHTYATIQDIWNMFLEFSSTYRFPQSHRERFRLLLSSRASGVPMFYTLDSGTGQVRAEGDFVTLGSGRDFFDGPMRETVARRYELVDQQTAKMHPAILPANWCLQLMERAQGLEASMLNAIGVGGYFHFSYQGPNEESRQQPTVYVLCDYIPAKHSIATWVYRVAFCEAALVVDCPIAQRRWVIFEPASWPHVLTMNDQELGDLKAEIDAKVAAQPYYNICGFGSINPVSRKRNPMVVTSKPQYVINWGGEQTPEFRTLAQAVFGSDDQVEQSIRQLQLEESKRTQIRP